MAIFGAHMDEYGETPSQVRWAKRSERFKPATPRSNDPDFFDRAQSRARASKAEAVARASAPHPRSNDPGFFDRAQSRSRASKAESVARASAPHPTRTAITTPRPTRAVITARKTGKLHPYVVSDTRSFFEHMKKWVPNFKIVDQGPISWGGDPEKANFDIVISLPRTVSKSELLQFFRIMSIVKMRFIRSTKGAMFTVFPGVRP